MAHVQPKSADSDFLSFNTKISPGLNSVTSPSPHDIAEMSGKDPALRYTWTIWEQIMSTGNDAKSAQYSDATHKVASFHTVKNFWRYWNHMPQPSELLDGRKFVRGQGETRSVVDALMVFRDGIKPEWEDVANTRGGHFQFQLKPAAGGGVIDEYWNNIMLGMIGGTIEPAEMITGVRLVDKLSQRGAFIRIEVWYSDHANVEKVDELQKSLEKCMSTRLDGSQSTPGGWGKTDRKSHFCKK